MKPGNIDKRTLLACAALLVALAVHAERFVLDMPNNTLAFESTDRS